MPGLSESEWAQFGLEGQGSAGCCEDYTYTYGAQPGQYSIECGIFTIDEIVAAGFETAFDEETQTNIGYMMGNNMDDYTWQGTWLSYQDTQSMTALARFAADMNLAGVFVFDISMDVMSRDRTVFTFNMTQLAYHTFTRAIQANKLNQLLEPRASLEVTN